MKTLTFSLNTRTVLSSEWSGNVFYYYNSSFNQIDELHFWLTYIRLIF